MGNELDVALYLLQNGADYTKPIFIRIGRSVVRNPAEDTPMYLVDVLREKMYEFYEPEYKYKMQIVDFLKSKGIDYRAAPIPEFIKQKAKEKHPDNWQEYLEKY